MDMMKLNDYRKSENDRRHEEMEGKWEGKPNAVHKEFKVPTAKCDQCEKLIDIVLKKDSGVLDAFVNTDEHVVHFYFDKTRTNLDNVEKLVLAAGFDVENKKGETEAHKTLPDCCK
jgi:cation transport ATPase